MSWIRQEWIDLRVENGGVELRYGHGIGSHQLNVRSLTRESFEGMVANGTV